MSNDIPKAMETVADGAPESMKLQTVAKNARSVRTSQDLKNILESAGHTLPTGKDAKDLTKALSKFESSSYKRLFSTEAGRKAFLESVAGKSGQELVDEIFATAKTGITAKQAEEHGLTDARKQMVDFINENRRLDSEILSIRSERELLGKIIEKAKGGNLTEKDIEAFERTLEDHVRLLHDMSEYSSQSADKAKMAEQAIETSSRRIDKLRELVTNKGFLSSLTGGGEYDKLLAEQGVNSWMKEAEHHHRMLGEELAVTERDHGRSLREMRTTLKEAMGTLPEEVKKSSDFGRAFRELEILPKSKEAVGMWDEMATFASRVGTKTEEATKTTEEGSKALEQGKNFIMRRPLTTAAAVVGGLIALKLLTSMGKSEEPARG